MVSRMVRAGGGAAVGLQDLLSGQVLRRFVEQIIKHAKKEEVFKVFLPGHVGCYQQFNNASWSRTTLRRSGGAVLRRDRPLRSSHGNLDIISCTCEHQPSCSCVSLRFLLEEFPRVFCVKVDPKPEADRCSQLEILDNLYQPLVSGSHGPGVLASVYGSFSEEFLRFST